MNIPMALGAALFLVSTVVRGQAVALKGVHQVELPVHVSADEAGHLNLEKRDDESDAPVAVSSASVQQAELPVRVSADDVGPFSLGKRDSDDATDLKRCNTRRWINTLKRDICRPGRRTDCVSERARSCGWGKQNVHYVCEDSGKVFCLARCWVQCDNRPLLEPCDPSYKENCKLSRQTPCSRPRGVGTYIAKYNCEGTMIYYCEEDCCCEPFPSGGIGQLPPKLCNPGNRVEAADHKNICPFTVFAL